MDCRWFAVPSCLGRGSRAACGNEHGHGHPVKTPPIQNVFDSPQRLNPRRLQECDQVSARARSCRGAIHRARSPKPRRARPTALTAQPAATRRSTQPPWIRFGRDKSRSYGSSLRDRCIDRRNTGTVTERNLMAVQVSASVASGDVLFWFGDLERVVCSSIGRPDRGFESLKWLGILPRWLRERFCFGLGI